MQSGSPEQGIYYFTVTNSILLPQNQQCYYLHPETQADSGAAFTTSTSGCVRHLTQDAVTQSWLRAPPFCMTFMVALAA